MTFTLNRLAEQAEPQAVITWTDVVDALGADDERAGAVEWWRSPFVVTVDDSGDQPNYKLEPGPRPEFPACWEWPFSDEDRAVAAAAGYSWGTAVLRHWQRDCCAVCGRGSERGRVQDHDHETGLLRGMLCPTCNTAEGRTDEPVFSRYEQRNPASILGLVAHYWSPGAGWAKARPALTGEEQKLAAGLLRVPYARRTSKVREDGPHAT